MKISAEVDEKESRPSSPEMSTCASWITSRRMVYVAFFLHGIAQLFSSNAVTNSSSFFIKHVSKSNMGFMVMDYLFVVLTTARLLFLLVSNYLISWKKPLNLVILTQFVKVGILLSFSVLVVFANLPVWLFALIVFVLVASSSVSQVIGFMAIFRFLSRLDPVFTHAYSNGQGLAGMLTAGFRLFTVWLEKTGYLTKNIGDELEVGVLIYFSASALVVFLGTSLLYVVLNAFEKRPHMFYEDYDPKRPSEMQETAPDAINATPRISNNTPQQLKSNLYDGINATVFLNSTRSLPAQLSGSAGESAEFEQDIVVVSRAMSPFTFAFTVKSPFHSQFKEAMESPSNMGKAEDIEVAAVGAATPTQSLSELSFKENLSETYRVFSEIKGYILSVFVHFFLVIFLVPNFLYIIESSVLRTSTSPPSGDASLYEWFLCQKDVFPVFMLFLFDVGDWIGRLCLLVKAFTVQKSSTLVAMSVFHGCVFLPAFCMSNVKILHTDFPVPSFLGHDAIYLPLTIVYGLYCGFFSTNYIMFASKSVQNGRDKRIANVLAINFLTIGLFCGAMSSLLMKLFLHYFLTKAPPSAT